MTYRVIAAAIFLAISQLAGAELSDFIELDPDSAAALERQNGVEPDLVLAHRDFSDAISAPVIQVLVFESDPQAVGSYSALRDAFRGMGEIEQILQMQSYFQASAQNDLVATSRIEGVDLDDDLLSVMIQSHYLDYGGQVYEQFQYMAWAANESKKCVITTDVEERLAAHYEDSIVSAFSELAAQCSAGLDRVATRDVAGSD